MGTRLALLLPFFVVGSNRQQRDSFELCPETGKSIECFLEGSVTSNRHRREGPYRIELFGFCFQSCPIPFSKHPISFSRIRMDAVKMFYPQTESLVLYRDLLHIPLAPGNFGNKRYHLSSMSNIGSSSISNGFVKISPTPHFKSFNKAAVRCAAVSSEMEATPSTYIPAAQIQLPEGPWKQVPGGVTAAIGFKAAGVYGGVRAASRKPDLALVSCDVDAAAAGAFTENVVAAAPVLYCRKVLSASSVARGVLINAGQANAATGDAGYQDTLDCAEAVAKLLGVNPETILIESTGVIGQRIKKEDLLNSLPKLVDSLSSTAEGAKSAAVAITTTDLVSKSVALETQIGGRTVKIGGMAKGSGMIHPNMATLLSVITSDAVVTVDLWRKMVLTAVKRSFNQITVDGDTSTNDTVVALASGLSGAREITSLEDLEAQQLQAALDAVMQGLAKSIASDGEGATCLIEVTVTGANSESDAAKVARSVASSSLTKAAIYGRDPNWGRIACAAGYAGIPFKLNDLHITLGDIVLMDGGQPLPFDRAAASAYLREAGETHGTVLINISIGSGEGVSQAWGCDLSYDYVKINAEYTT